MDGDRGWSKTRETHVYKLHYKALDIIETIITPKKTGAKQKKRTRQEDKIYDMIKLEGENEEQLRDPEKESRSFLLSRKGDECMEERNASIHRLNQKALEKIERILSGETE